MVVGGSQASNPQSQLGLAGSNNGSNLFVNRNIFTYTDQVSVIQGRNQFTAGVWFQRLQSNEQIALSQYGQLTFTGVPGFLAGSWQFPVRSGADTGQLALVVRRVVLLEDVIRVRPKSDGTLGLPGRIDHRLERSVRESFKLYLFSDWNNFNATDDWKFAVHRQSFEVPAPAAGRPGVEPVEFEQQ